MNIRMAICDDDPVFADLLKKYVLKYFNSDNYSVNIDIYTDSYRFLRNLQNPDVVLDVIFLDIDMPHLNGLELASRIRPGKENSFFIFVSGVESMVFQSFSVNPFWFVRKRCWKKEMPSALSALKRKLHEREEQLVSIFSGSSIYQLDIHTLMYIESTDKIVHLHYKSAVNDIDIRYRLTELEELLAPKGFIRVHKGYLVNYRFIFSIDRFGITLDNGETIPVSKYRLQEIRQLYGSLV